MIRFTFECVTVSADLLAAKVVIRFGFFTNYTTMPILTFLSLDFFCFHKAKTKCQFWHFRLVCKKKTDCLSHLRCKGGCSHQRLNVEPYRVDEECGCCRAQKYQRVPVTQVYCRCKIKANIYFILL